MTKKPLTVEFRLPPTGTSPAPKPLPGSKAERLRQVRADRKARNLALAYYFDALIRAGEVENLAAVARMCGVSRARIAQLVELMSVARTVQEYVIFDAVRKQVLRPVAPSLDGQ